MHKLLLTTALVLTAGSAYAHDNYKIQLDSLDNAFQCQDHFQRGTDIAGTVDEFEFCVWYLNSNRKGFIRNDMFYDILPTGDVIAVKVNQLRTKQSAEKVITAAVQAIIDVKVAEAKAAAEANADKRIAELVAQAAMSEADLRDQLNAKIAELADALAQGELDATMIAELSATITGKNTEIADLIVAVETVEAMLASSEMDLESVREELRIVQDAAEASAMTHAQELANKNMVIAAKQGMIDGLAIIRDGLETTNAALQNTINALTTEVNDLQAELTAEMIAFSDYKITFNQDAIDAAYDAGIASVDITSDNAVVYWDGVADGINEAQVNAADYGLWTAGEVEAEKTTAYNNGVNSVDTDTYFNNGVDSVDSTHDLNIKGRFGVMGLNIHDFGDTIVHEDATHSINVQPVVDAYIASLDLDSEAQAALDLVNADLYTKKIASYTAVTVSSYHSNWNGNDYVWITLGTKDDTRDAWLNVSQLETRIENGNWTAIVNQITNTAKQAYEEGYNDGYSDGYQDGYKDGFKDGVNSLKS